MSYAVLALKVAGSMGGIAAVGGGSYVAYVKSTSIKNHFSGQTPQQTSDTENKPASHNEPAKPLVEAKTNIVLVRYKEGKPSPTQTISAADSLTCVVDSTTEMPCKIYKFGVTPKLNNALTESDISSLVAVTSTEESFVDNAYLAIEWTGAEKAATELHNKTFTVKKDTTTIGTFAFDQIIIGQAGQTGGKVDEAQEETYIVKKTNTWSAQEGSTDYSCRFNPVELNIENNDPNCKLTKIIPKTSTDKITTFDHLKSLNEKITAENLKTETTGDTYFKLTVNSKLLYNLSFSEASTSSIQIELVNQSNTSIGSLDLKQKLVDNKFIGKTDLFLAKVLKNTDDLTGSITSTQCNWDGSTVVKSGTQFLCFLNKATLETNQELKDLTIDKNSVTTSDAADTFVPGTYYLIRINAEQSITSLTEKKKIFYQIADSSSSRHKQIELEITALMSGLIINSHKPMFISEPKITTQQ